MLLAVTDTPDALSSDRDQANPSAVRCSRLTSVKDCLGNIRGEIAETNQPREIGRADALPLGQRCKWHPVAAGEGGVEPAGSDQQLDQPRIRFCCGKRVGPLDQHLDLPSRAAQPYWDGQDLSFVVDRARQ